MHTYFNDHGTLDLIMGTGRTLNRRVDDLGSSGTLPKTLSAVSAQKTADDKKAAALTAATKDGAVSEKDKTTFGKDATLIKSQEDRLHEALKKKDSAAATTANGALTSGGLASGGLANSGLANGGLGATPASDTLDSLNRRAVLDKLDKGDRIDTIEQKIADHKSTLESFPAGSKGRADYQKTIDGLTTKLAERKTAEAPIAQDVRDKRQLGATLELDKAAVEASKPEAAKDDYQALKEKAQPMIDVFNKSKGKLYHGSVFLGMGEDWGSEKNLTFDKMVDTFHNDPDRLKRWTEENKDNPEAGAAVGELQSVVKSYEEIRKSSDSADKRIGEINAEIGHNKASIDADLKVLSKPTVDGLNKELDGGKTAASAADTKAADPATSKTATSDTATGDTANPAPSGNSGGDKANPAPSGNSGGDKGAPVTSSDGTPPTTKSVLPAGQPGAPGPDKGVAPAGQPGAPKVTVGEVVANHGGLRPVHKVASGDSLAQIAADYSKAYGRNISWNDIYAANRGHLDPPFQRNGVTYVMIYAGQDLSIPGVQDTIDDEVKKNNG